MLSQPAIIGSHRQTGPPFGSEDNPASPSDAAAANSLHSSAAPGSSSDVGQDSRRQRIAELEAQKQASPLRHWHARRAW